MNNKFCKHCGAQLNENTKFCSKCGAPTQIAEPKQASKNFSGKNIIIMICLVIIVALSSAIALLLNNKSDSKDNNTQNDKTSISSTQGSTSNDNKSQNATELSMQLTQVDTHNYPEVQLYFQLSDVSGNIISNFENSVLKITEQNSKPIELTPQTISNKNVCFVMDISGSMLDNDKYTYGKNAILQLLSQIEGIPNYQAALISFNNTQNTLEDFTTDYTNIKNELENIYPSGQTAFWDSLEHSLLRTNTQNGQKCIIAATDGMDNASRTTKENIVNLSKELQIPIYIITFDDSIYNDLASVAQATGGKCFTASDLQNLSSIYNNILEMQTNQFVVSFTSDGNTTETERNINLSFEADGYTASCDETYHRVEEIYAEQISNNIISSVNASSYLEEYYQSTGQLIHKPENTIDGSYRTAWVENAAGDGIGEWIELSFDRTYTINGIEISNGYKKSSELYLKNNRLSSVRIHFSDGTHQDFTLTDTFEGAQRITFAKPAVTNSIKLEILSVYSGSKYQDTCITELNLF